MRPLKARIQVWFFFLGGGGRLSLKETPDVAERRGLFAKIVRSRRDAERASSPSSSLGTPTPTPTPPPTPTPTPSPTKRQSLFRFDVVPRKKWARKTIFFSIFISKIDYCRLLLNQRIGLNSFILRYDLFKDQFFFFEIWRLVSSF